MQIIWRGQSCFQIISVQGKNGYTNIVVNPFNEKTGLRVPKLEADILLVSHSHHDHNNIKAVLGSSFLCEETSSLLSRFANAHVINGPGEYEIKGIFIQGIDSYYDPLRGKERLGDETSPHLLRFANARVLNTIYVIEAEGMRICHLGNFGQKKLTDEQIEKIGDIDVLMLPIGGIYTIDAKEATEIMSQIEPKIIIPMHYQIPKLKIKLEGIDKFLKIVGIKTIEPLPKLLIKKKDLSEEGVKIITLKP